MKTNSGTFMAGVRAVLPLLVGVFPFGMIYGALALKAGLPRALAQLMSIVIFAGSAQLITTQLAREAAPGLVIILTVGVVNLRHILYSASVAPYVKDLSGRWKGLLAYLLTDEAYAATVVNYELHGRSPSAHWFFLGAGSSLWLTWQISSALGIFLGSAIPASWELDFALPVTFIAMLVPLLKDRSAVSAALAAGAVAFAAHALPFRLGLMLAAIVGIGVGMLVESR